VKHYVTLSTETGPSLRGLQTAPVLKCRIVVVNTALVRIMPMTTCVFLFLVIESQSFHTRWIYPSYFLADHGSQLQVGNRDILIEGVV
jgi:hypothetical protein